MCRVPMNSSASDRTRGPVAGWDHRQAVMAVANMVESLLRGGLASEPDREDHQLAPVPAGDRVRAAVDHGAGTAEHRVDPAAVRPGRYRRRVGLAGRTDRGG